MKEPFTGDPPKEDEEQDEEQLGEGLVIPAESIQPENSDAFFEALMDFQYGTGEESADGFRRMAELASPKQTKE